MKYKKFFRVLAVALTLALLLVAIPAVPASAAISVNIVPDEGEIGDTISVSGFGTYPLEYYIFFSSQNAALGDEIDTEVTTYDFLVSVSAAGVAGAYSAINILVPAELTDGEDDESVHGGTYYIYMTRSNNKAIVAETTFTVIGIAEITDFDPNEGPVGTEVEISGGGFAPDETIIVEYDGEEIDIESGDEKTDENGEFSLFIIIPESEFGDHTITIRGEDSLAEVEDTFTVEPEISVNPASGETGTVITVTGTGFDRRNGVDFSFGGNPATNVVWLVESGGRTNSDGTFAVNLTVPDVDTGSFTILAEDEDDSDIFATTTFAVAVNTAINLSPTTGIVGDEITIVGSSFGSGATATLYFDNVSLGTVPVGIDGSFTASLDIPASKTGVHTIGVEDTAGRSATASVSVKPEMTMSPLTGATGDSISVSGTGFGSSKNITILYGNSAVTPTTAIKTGSEGSFNGSFFVPSIPGGIYTVTVTDGTSNLTASFTVVAGVIINPTSGKVGDGVGIAGYGFGASKNITIMYGNTPIISTTPIITDPNGIFSGGFVIREIPGGTAALSISDGITSVSVNLTVGASVIINPTSGGMGDGVGISGYGFGANKNVTILIKNIPVTPLVPITAGSDGSFNGSFNIPAMPGGAAIISINDGSNTVTVDFTVGISDISISPKTSNASPGYIGMEISISGDGYTADAPIEVTYDGAVLTTDPDRTGNNGSFDSTFEVPKSTAGEHTVIVSINGVEVEQFTFIMESAPPLIPQPLLPYLDSSPDQPVRFDWEDVTDSQNPPVTYILEVATDAGFTNKVLEKTGLAGSEYTITEAEQLELGNMEGTGPFYWHVKAVDNAGNESGWTGAGTFYVGGGWPGWLTWLLVGLGGLAVFILALWLGRRIAYSSY
ncbi:MAG: hypothetical protein ABH934_00065 [Chloroflexota bacterium]